MKPHRLVQSLAVAVILAAFTIPTHAQSPAHAQPKPEPTPEQNIAALIRKLGDNDWRAREAASESLSRLGESALPHLDTARLESSDPEVCVRAEAILAAFHARLLTTIVIDGGELRASSLGDLLDKLAALTQRAHPRRGGVSFSLTNDGYRGVGFNSAVIEGKCSLLDIMERALKPHGLRFQIRHDKVLIYENREQMEGGRNMIECG